MEEKEYKVIGNYVPPTEDGGDDEVIERAFFRQGYIFKNPYAFYHNPNDVCYIPELSDTTYTGNEIRAICNNQEEFAEELFEHLDWQHPESLREDWFVNDEWDYCEKCEKLYESYNVKKCPHCGAERKV